LVSFSSRGAPRLLSLVRQIVTERIPFGEEDAVLAARLFNSSGRRRGSLTDCMIAASAIQARAALATQNAVDFRRFQADGLEIASV
jgi:predicted nucleic acid-binding protein